MFYKKPLLFLILFINSFNAFPAVFTVTSNADSGPGTLRDALTQAAANGSATKDYIYFNLPGTTLTQRTITLLSQLPDVSSNVVIDGTTQPGGSLNLGDAGVNITVNDLKYIIPGFLTGALILDGATNVQIYGLSINGFAYLQDQIESGSDVCSGLLILNSQHITVGAPGKGNYFADNDNDIYADTTGAATPDSINLKIQSNFFGFQSKTLSYSPMGVFLSGNDILFGGDGSGEGNHLLGVLTFYGVNIQLVHNYLGVDKNGNPLTDGAQINGGYVGTSNVIIRNNMANNFNVALQYVDNFQIYSNTDFGYYIGTLGSITSGLSMYFCSNGVIGSNDIAGQNIIHSTHGYLGIGNQDSNNIQLLKNSISCSDVPYLVEIDNVPIAIPNITVLVNNNTEFSGTANPNSTIYVYQDPTDCPICNPVLFYTTVTADANGAWKVTGDFTGKKMLANALLNQNSSEFTDPELPDNYLNGVASMPSCGKNNGSIAIKDSVNTLKIQWFDANNQMVGSGSKINNLGPGNYYARAFNGNCSSQSAVYELYDLEPQIIAQNVKITNPSCGKGGAITGLIVTTSSQDAASYTWTDQDNKIVGNTPDINSLQSGKYLFTLTDVVTQCSVSYGPVALKSTVGPNIDQSKAATQSTNCGQSTGSITGITSTGTGTLKYIWWNDQQQTVSTTQDLLNQPAGIYKLEVTDDSQCGPVYTTDLTIAETNGITMDESKAQTTVASCSNNNGSVTGITVSGATQYQWLDANNKVVGNTTDLQNIAPGTYTLTASNSFGCTATSKAYTVGQLPPTKFPAYAATNSPACFQQTDGSVTVAVDALVKSVQWVNANGGDAGANAALTNIGAGTYQLYLTDQNGCENYYNTYTVAELPEYQVVSSGTVTNDQCNLGVGSISAADIEGGLQPYTYTWYNSGNQQIGTGPSISNLSAGTYTLNVISARCGESNTLYTVANETADVAAPSVQNVALCSSGSAIISVNNPSSSAIYRLYANQTDTQPLDQQKGGTFIVKVTGNTSFYISQLNGSCESARAEVKVTVGLSALNIANTFTPNGDGINDFWVINGIANYPAAEVQVFTRNGQRIFDSKGYAAPFDGTFNGKNLPDGVYYYIIDLHSNCSLLSGSLTVIR